MGNGYTVDILQPPQKRKLLRLTTEFIIFIHNYLNIVQKMKYCSKIRGCAWWSLSACTSSSSPPSPGCSWRDTRSTCSWSRSDIVMYALPSRPHSPYRSNRSIFKKSLVSPLLVNIKNQIYLQSNSTIFDKHKKFFAHQKLCSLRKIYQLFLLFQER